MDVRKIQLMIVGAQKAGTSSLQNYLGQHPNICTHKKGEFVFFLDERQDNLGYDKVYTRYFGKCSDDNKIILAKSAGVMYVPDAVRRLHIHNPDAQLVVLLRNPIDRAYSAYWHYRRRGWEDLHTFEEALEAEPKRLREGGEKGRHLAYVDRGMYYKQIALLFDYFGRNNVRLFLFEDLKNDPMSVCNRIFRLFGLDYQDLHNIGHRYNRACIARSERIAQVLVSQSPFKKFIRGILPDDIAFYIKSKVRSLNEREFSLPPMDPKTRQRLVEYFRPHNMELSELLGRDLTHWNR